MDDWFFFDSRESRKRSTTDSGFGFGSSKAMILRNRWKLLFVSTKCFKHNNLLKASMTKRLCRSSPLASLRETGNLAYIFKNKVVLGRRWETGLLKGFL